MQVNGGVHVFLSENRKAVQHAMGYREDDPACNSRAAGHQIYILDLLLLAETSKYKRKTGEMWVSNWEAEPPSS